MRPSRVRRRILDDHEALRAGLAALEELAEGHGDAARVLSLRLRGTELLEALERHLQWEDRHLVPVLRESDAWGLERARRFEAEHREQREVLRHVLGVLEDAARPAPLVARAVRDFAALMRTDMEEEESAFLDRAVLRDDVVGIDVETG